MKRVFATTKLSSGRRFAAGLDVGPAGVRAIVVSQRLASTAEIQVEHVGYATMPAEAMADAEILDTDAVATAILEALAAFTRYGAAASLRVAMALPPQACVLGSMAVPQPRSATRRPYSEPFVAGRPDQRLAQAVWRGITQGPRALALDRLEPAVRAQAEALSGIERSALALDWCLAGSPYVPSDHLTVAAAAQTHIDARLEAAAGAGLHLIAIDAQPLAALRACRFDATREVGPDELHAVLWVGHDTLHIWALQGGQRLRELQFPLHLPSAENVLPPLEGFARGLSTQIANEEPRSAPDRALGCVWLAGELDMLEQAGVSAEAMGDALGCPAFEFEALSEYASPGISYTPANRALARRAPLAVAFGLALRGVAS